jgi:hypothetical protein
MYIYSYMQIFLPIEMLYIKQPLINFITPIEKKWYVAKLF